jgi:hypothetical protein
VDQRHRALEVLQIDQHVARPLERLKGVVLRLDASHNHLAALARTEVAADAQQVDVAGAGFGIVVPEIAQARGVSGIRQKAAAGRLGNIGDAVVLRQLVLPVAAAARDVEQARAVDDAFDLGLRGREQLRGERTEHLSLEAQLLVDLAEAVPRLRHRPLVEHLARDQEARALALQRFAGPGDHHDAAVDAGIHVLAVAELRGLHHVDVILSEVRHPHREAQVAPHLHERLDILPARSRRDRVAAEVGDEADTRDRDPLLEDGPDGQEAVQTAGQKGNRFSVHVLQEIRELIRPEYINRRR